MVRRPLLLVALLAAFTACAPKAEMHPPRDIAYATRANANQGASDREVVEQTKEAGDPSESKVYERGQASWYGSAFAGRKTANGERFDPRLFTAAHRTLPFGTWVEVRRIDTGRTVRVRINDRGPHVANRVIDLSKRAADDLDIVRLGVVSVELRVVSGP